MAIIHSSKKTKRFIAAAVCPECQSLDTLALWQENQVEIVSCVQCGYQQQQQKSSAAPYLRTDEQLLGLFPTDKTP